MTIIPGAFLVEAYMEEIRPEGEIRFIDYQIPELENVLEINLRKLLHAVLSASTWGFDSFGFWT